MVQVTVICLLSNYIQVFIRDSGIFRPEPGLSIQLSSESNFLESLESDVVDARSGKHVSKIYMGYSM